MRQLTREWIDKAEGDWFAAQQLCRARKHPNYDAACFHAQQCAEKYLKARLTESQIDFGRTHNLLWLLGLTLEIEPLWTVLHKHLNALNIYSVDFRYPGKSAIKEDAKDAINHCREIRRIVRAVFGLNV